MMFLRAIRPLALDFLSTIVFLIAFAIWNDVRLAIVMGVAFGLAEMAWEWRHGIKPGVMQWMSLGLVIATGLASLLTNDPRFVMFKPTVTYIIVGSVMLAPGWMLRYIPKAAVERVPAQRFIMWGYIWSALMFLSAGVNLTLVFTVDPATWALAMTIWGPSTKLALFLVQYAMIRSEARRSPLSRSASSPETASLAGCT